MPNQSESEDATPSRGEQQAGELTVVGQYGYFVEDGFEDMDEAQDAVETYDEIRPEHAPHGVEKR